MPQKLVVKKKQIHCIKAFLKFCHTFSLRNTYQEPYGTALPS